VRFVADNTNFLVFLMGFGLCCASIAAVSIPLAGIVGGVILMGAAVYPILMLRKP